MRKCRCLTDAHVVTRTADHFGVEQAVPRAAVPRTVIIKVPGIGCVAGENCGERVMVHPHYTRRNDLLTWALHAVIALAVFVYVAFFMPRAAGGPIGKNHPSVGKLLGNLTLDPLTGAARRITNADLVGKVALIDYWGPRC